MNILEVTDLGLAIREARKKQNLTQEDLAGLTGTGRRFIVEIENGKKTAQLGKVLNVLKSLGISIHLHYTWDR